MALERAFAQRGQTVRLRAEFRLGGVIFDPSEVRQVEIRSSTGTVLATISGASIVHDATGKYHVDWDIPASEATGVHYDVWFSTASGGGTEAQGVLTFYVHAAEVSEAGLYITTDEAKAYLADGTALTDSEIDGLVRRASQIAEDCTGQNFAPKTETRTFHGPGQPMLNVRRPIRSVSRILILGSPPGNGDCDADLSDVRIGESGTTITLGNIVPLPFRTLRAHLSPRFGGGTGAYFPRGFRNIRVTGQWGAYDAPPSQIKHAVGLLVRYMGECDDPHGGEAAFESERISGDRDYTIRKIWNNVKQNATTGYSDVDAIFARYTAPPVVVGVI